MKYVKIIDSAVFDALQDDADAVVLLTKDEAANTLRRDLVTDEDVEELRVASDALDIPAMLSMLAKIVIGSARNPLNTKGQ
jgi:hypothetical protein